MQPLSIHLGITFLKASTSSCFPSLLQSDICLSLTNYLMEILTGWIVSRKEIFLPDGQRERAHAWDGCFHISVFHLFLLVPTCFAIVFGCTKYCHDEFSGNICEVYP